MLDWQAFVFCQWKIFDTDTFELLRSADCCFYSVTRCSHGPPKMFPLTATEPLLFINVYYYKLYYTLIIFKQTSESKIFCMKLLLCLCFLYCTSSQTCISHQTPSSMSLWTFLSSLVINSVKSIKSVLHLQEQSAGCDLVCKWWCLIFRLMKVF